MRRTLSPTDNKYSRGVVAVAAGSTKYPGAAILTVGGARRGNAGYVKYLSQDRRISDLVINRFPDVVTFESFQSSTAFRVDALVIGPGLSTVETPPEGIPLILDGESISLILERGFIGRHPISVITPHEGELRHCGLDLQTPLSTDERKKVAHQIAHDREVIVVLKGNKTVIASPEGEIFVDEIGGPELATAGSGDILAGLIGSFLVSAKDMSGAMDLVCRAVTLHSHAGRFAAERFTSVTALEILDSLAHV
jgi:hydroxyethylthiazole kinase-like uncharacterized protein yjeF